MDKYGTVTPEEEEMFNQMMQQAHHEVEEVDLVNKPKHYELADDFEVYDLRQMLARKAMLAEIRYDLYSDWDRALEYLIRMWDKNGVQDAKKARWYINKMIEKIEE